MTIDKETKEKAVALKNEGNKAFKAHNWPTAIDFYSKAIELDDTEPTYFANRAQVGAYLLDYCVDIFLCSRDWLTSSNTGQPEVRGIWIRDSRCDEGNRA